MDMEIRVDTLAPLRGENAKTNGRKDHNKRGHESLKVDNFEDIDIIIVEYHWNVNVEVEWEHDHGEDRADGCHGNRESEIYKRNRMHCKGTE